MKLLWFAVCATAMSAQSLVPIDDAINTAIQEKTIPGAVLMIGHDGKVVYERAYGLRALVPREEPMTMDTIFDCASLTKVVATTSSVMKLFEQGKFRLNDRVTDYLPLFQGGKSDITIRNLLTHFSGLQPDVPLVPVWSGYDTGMNLAYTFKPGGPPATRYVYSDINFEVLGELVHKLSGQLVSDYARQNIFLPLGMKDSMFNPPSTLLPRIAPTERNPGKTGAPLRGTVHDPTARYMGGIAGHAGLFSTAADLARFAQMMLNGGELDGVRMFNPLTVVKFTTPQSPPDQPILRGLGWDLDSPHSSNRGELFPLGSFGHTGYTGTSLWIDPATKSYVVLLTNRVHPEDANGTAVTQLRAKVATMAAATFGVAVQGMQINGYNETLAGAGARREVGRNGATKTGLDVLVAQNFAGLQGKRVGLITNHTGVDQRGKRNIDLIRGAGVQVAAVFSPEHGFLGKEERSGIQDTVDAETGVRVYSLYGATQRPTPTMLQSIDALVFDIADVGVHFYTYETTMAYAMEEAAKAKIPFYVLDRPNPITGTRVAGPLLDAANKSFVGYLPGVPVQHGMTMGELAKMFNSENQLGADLHVVAMQDWNRGDWFDATNLPWVDPSPNMRTLKAATLYPGLCLMESSRNWSLGRGTDTPFELVGADFIDGRALASYLNKRLIPGVRAYPTKFTPTASNFRGMRIDGVKFEITNRELLDATRLGLELAVAVQTLYPGKIDFALSKRLIGSDDVVRRLAAGEDPRLIQQSYQEALEAFVAKREQYLLYK